MAGKIRVKVTAKKKPKDKKPEIPPGWYTKQAIAPSPYAVQRGPLFIPPDVAEELGRFPRETITEKSKELQQHARDHTRGQSTREAETVPPIGKAHDEAIAAARREQAKMEKAAEAARKKSEAAAEKARKAAEKEAQAAAKKAAVEAERERKAAEKAAEAARKKTAAEEKRARDAADKEREAMERADAKGAEEEAKRARRMQEEAEKIIEQTERAEAAAIKKREAEIKEAERWQMAVPGAQQAAAARSRDALGRGYATNVPRPGGVDKKGLATAAPGKSPRRAGTDYATGAFADKEQRERWLAEVVAKAVDDPEGFFARLSKGSIRGESMLRSIRTKSQRLNTHGLWFFETVQHNPAHSVGKFILNTMRGFGPHGLAISSAIVAIVSSAFVLQKSIKNLSIKGLPLNIDYHRSIVDETVGMLTLEEQKRRDLGLAGVIADPVNGYRPVDGTEIYNTREVADSVRLTKLTQEEKARRLY